MTAEALCSDLTVVRCVIVPFTGGMVRFGIGEFTEIFMILLIAVAIALELVEPPLYAAGVRADVMINVLAGIPIGFTLDIDIDVFARADANI